MSIYDTDLQSAFHKPILSIQPTEAQLILMNKANERGMGGPLILACFHVASENRPALDLQTRRDAMQLIAAYQPVRRYGLNQAENAWARWKRAVQAGRGDAALARGIGWLFSCEDFNSGYGKSWRKLRPVRHELNRCIDKKLLTKNKDGME